MCPMPRFVRSGVLMIRVSQIHEGIWDSKLMYRVVTPRILYVFGTQITTTFQLTPLGKGTQIASVRLSLVEHMKLRGQYAGRPINSKSEKVVASRMTTVQPDSARLVPDGVDDVDHIFDEMYQFKVVLELPRNLKECRQSVSVEGINIWHRLNIFIDIANADGHISQVRLVRSGLGFASHLAHSLA